MLPADRPLTHRRLVEVLSYDSETGIFRWRTASSRRIKPGDEAGTIAADGYRVIQIDGLHYKAARLAWFYVYERWPRNWIDHRDLNKMNNRISNLREADGSQNHANVALRSSNTSGQTGVSPVPYNRWKATIRKNGERFYLGTFLTIEEAAAAYQQAAKDKHGAFAPPASRPFPKTHRPMRTR